VRLTTGFLALTIGVIACSDGTAPRVTASPVTVVYTDALGHASVVRSGGTPETISALDATSLFASSSGAVLAYKNGRISVFRFSDPVARPFEERQESGALVTRGAVSPDGHLLAYATALDTNVFIHTVDITTGARDSVNVAHRDDLLAGPQIIFSVPVWSPSGDTVAFLLPNNVGMQILLYEHSSRRLEQKVMTVPVSTYYEPLAGHPRWTPDGTIRFLVRRKYLDALHDTLAVVRVYPREVFPHSELLYTAVAPDSLSMMDAFSYSFSADGKTLAFAMFTGDKTAIMVMRQGRPVLETLLYDDGPAPTDVLLVP
jgi:hypothetical protein